MSFSALDTIGKLIDDPDHKMDISRDAIHIATLPIFAGELLEAGDHVGIVDNKATTQTQVLVGIVDPFLEVTVHPGEQFWLCIYPRTITSLTHAWSHPVIDGVVDAVKERFLMTPEIAKEWVKKWLRENGDVEYSTLLRSVYSSDLDEDYLTILGEDAYGAIPNELWDHLEIAEGEKFPTRPKYFSCAC